MTTIIGFVVFVVLVLGGLAGLQAGGTLAQAVIILLSAGVTFAIARANDNAKQARELEAKLSTDKRTLYKAYLDMVRSFLAKGAKAPREGELLESMQSFVFNSVLNASDEVIRAHNAFTRLSQAGGNPKIVIPALGDVMLAMRRDAGEKDTTLTNADLLRPLINDLDDNLEIFPEWEAKKREGGK